MGKIERALAGDPFSVDETQCLLLGTRLRSFSPASETYPWDSLPPEAKVCFKVFFIAICHQINWDFLQERLFSRFAEPTAARMIDKARSATPAYVRSLLEGYHRPERIRAPERARYLRETAEALGTPAGAGILDKLVNCRLVFGEGGLLEALNSVPAFREDPLAKKSNVLAQELARERILEFGDADSIAPAIDYHIIRLYLRTGRVFAPSPDVFGSLKTGMTHRPRLLRLLREATARALERTAHHANLPVHELNYVEWQIGRSRCERDSMNCDGPWPASVSDGSVTALSACCPFREHCNAYNMAQWRDLVEPALKATKAFY